VKGFFQDTVLWTIFLGWLWTMILLISASWVAGITDVTHGARLVVFWGSFIGMTVGFSGRSTLSLVLSWKVWWAPEADSSPLKAHQRVRSIMRETVGCEQQKWQWQTPKLRILPGPLLYDCSFVTLGVITDGIHSLKKYTYGLMFWDRVLPCGLGCPQIC
jgi:hypothetical protein